MKHYFKHIIVDLGSIPISEKLRVIRLYPHFFQWKKLYCFLSCQKGGNNEGFTKKFQGQNLWSRWMDDQIFLSFFEELSEDLLEYVEDLKVSGKVNGAMNATFIALIPKKDKP